MNKKLVKCVMGALCALSLSACATMNDLVGKSSYDPASYGTKALLSMVASADSTASDAAAAAKELANRRLTEEEGRQLFQALQAQPKEKVRVAILKTIAAKQLDYLREPVVAYALKAPDEDTAVEAAVTAIALTTEQEDALKSAAGFLLKGKFPAQRARAAKLVATTFPEYAERLFVRALEKETSASAATLMCEFLAQKGSPACLPTLESIANDVGRKYEADKWLGVKTDSESVRAAAVRGVERLGMAE
jgi:hypothetical protein